MKKISTIIAAIVACFCLTGTATVSSTTVADSTWDCHHPGKTEGPTSIAS